LAFITTASVHDVNVLDNLQYEANSFYILDRGYVDFSRLYNIHLKQAYFATRAKSNFKFRQMYSNPVDKTAGVLYDQIGVLEVHKSKKNYPDRTSSNQIS